jgi:hypothetical protein
MALVPQPAPAPPASSPSPGYKRLLSRLYQSDNILAAIAGAGVTGFAAIAVALMTRDDKTDAGEFAVEPSISITSPSDEGSVPEVLDDIRVTGQVSNLGPGQTVWVFDRAAVANDLWTHDGPCPVGEDGTFTCPSLRLTTAPTDPAGKEFRLYAAIIDDTDQLNLIWHQVRRAQNIWEPMWGRTEPLGLAHDYVVVEKAG